MRVCVLVRARALASVSLCHCACVRACHQPQLEAVVERARQHLWQRDRKRKAGGPAPCILGLSRGQRTPRRLRLKPRRPPAVLCARLCARVAGLRVRACVVRMLCMFQACYFWCASCSPLRRVCCRLFCPWHVATCPSQVAARPLRVACRLLPLWLFRIVRTFSGMRFSVCRLRTKQQAPCNARLATRDFATRDAQARGAERRANRRTGHS